METRPLGVDAPYPHPPFLGPWGPGSSPLLHTLGVSWAPDGGLEAAVQAQGFSPLSLTASQGS